MEHLQAKEFNLRSDNLCLFSVGCPQPWPRPENRPGFLIETPAIENRTMERLNSSLMDERRKLLDRSIMGCHRNVRTVGPNTIKQRLALQEVRSGRSEAAEPGNDYGHAGKTTEPPLQKKSSSIIQ